MSTLKPSKAKIGTMFIFIIFSFLNPAMQSISKGIYKEEIKKLLSINSTEYIWVTQQEIKQGKSNGNHLIAEQTKKIFHNKFLHQWFQ